MNPSERPPRIVRWTLRLEEGATVLDGPVHALEPSIQALFGTGTRASVLRGEWLGHAVHPLLTDVAAPGPPPVCLIFSAGPTRPPRPRGSSEPACSPPAQQPGPGEPSGRQPVRATSGWASSTL